MKDLIVFSEVTGSRKKKTFGGEQCLPCFYVIIDGSTRLSRKQKTELCERKVQQGSRDKDRLTSASECILNKVFLFVYYVKNKEFIINPDDRMFFLFTTSPSIVDNKLRFQSPKARQAHYVLYVLSILTVKHRLEPGVCFCCCCCCCLSPVLFSLFFIQNIV